MGFRVELPQQDSGEHYYNSRFDAGLSQTVWQDCRHDQSGSDRLSTDAAFRVHQIIDKCINSNVVTDQDRIIFNENIIRIPDGPRNLYSMAFDEVVAQYHAAEHARNHPFSNRGDLQSVVRHRENARALLLQAQTTFLDPSSRAPERTIWSGGSEQGRAHEINRSGLDERHRQEQEIQNRRIESLQHRRPNEEIQSHLPVNRQTYHYMYMHQGSRLSQSASGLPYVGRR